MPHPHRDIFRAARGFSETHVQLRGKSSISNARLDFSDDESRNAFGMSERGPEAGLTIKYRASINLDGSLHDRRSRWRDHSRAAT
jgi:hypothetical protein